MYQFNNEEMEMLLEALNLLEAQTKRMQNSKPKFTAVFQAITTNITALKIKLQTPPSKTK